MKMTDDTVCNLVLTEHVQFSLSLVKIWVIEYEGNSVISVRKSIQKITYFQPKVHEQLIIVKKGKARKERDVLEGEN